MEHSELEELYREAESHAENYYSDSQNNGDEGRLAESGFLRIASEDDGEIAERAMFNLHTLYGFFDTMMDCAYDGYEPSLHDYEKSKEWYRRHLELKEKRSKENGC